MSQPSRHRRSFVRDAATQSHGGVTLTDRSLQPRAGFKGPGTVEWLSGQGIDLRPEPNCAFRQTDGSLVAMLSWSEALILDPERGTGPAARLGAAWSLDGGTRCYAVPRQDSHYWFALAGNPVPQLLAKLCAVDLRAVSSVAQTMVAKTSAILIRDPVAQPLAFHLLGDSASAQYVWNTLLDAMKH